MRVTCVIYAGDMRERWHGRGSPSIVKSGVILSICGSFSADGLFTVKASGFWEIGIGFAFG